MFHEGSEPRRTRTKLKNSKVKQTNVFKKEKTKA